MTATVPASRAEAATLLLDVVASACPAGEVDLIGSMASPGHADVFSDIDVRWSIPPEQAAAQLQILRSTLQRAGKVESLRVDPDQQPDERLVFVRFEDWPLWWRVDLEIHSRGVGSIDVPDSDPWSPQESACMGVVVTLKALARRQPSEAETLFARALERADAHDVPGRWPSRLSWLLDQIEAGDPNTADLVSRTRLLSREVLGE